MSVDHLYFAWWLDAEGWLWIRHDCNGDQMVWHPPPPWHLTDDGQAVTPSFDCRRCGRHTILTAADRNRDVSGVAANSEPASSLDRAIGPESHI